MESQFQNYLPLLHFLFTSCLINSMNSPIRSRIHASYLKFYLKKKHLFFFSNTIWIFHWAFTWLLLCFLLIFTLTLLDGKNIRWATLIDELCKIPQFLRFPPQFYQDLINPSVANFRYPFGYWDAFQFGSNNKF